MKNIKVTLFCGDIAQAKCSVLFMKHIQREVCLPESAINDRLSVGGKDLFKENELLEAVDIPTNNLLPYPFIHVINFLQKDLPFTYSSVDAYARKIIDFTFKSSPAIPFPITTIATAVHGPGAGLDSGEAMEKMLLAIANEMQQREPNDFLEEIIFIERNLSVFERLKDRIPYLVEKGTLVNNQA